MKTPLEINRGVVCSEYLRAFLIFMFAPLSASCEAEQRGGRCGAARGGNCGDEEKHGEVSGVCPWVFRGVGMGGIERDLFCRMPRKVLSMGKNRTDASE